MNSILLIEDNEQLQRYLSEYLAASGFTTHILEDYDAVLETISVHSPKLILLDINLPKFDAGQPKSVLSSGGIELSEDTMSVSYKGAGTELSKNEYRVLRLS